MTQYAVTDPTTGEVVEEFPTVDAAGLERAVAAAAAAHAGPLADLGVAERAALLRRVAQLHRERREELADLIVREMGKVREGALGEVDFAADIVEYYADNAEAIMADGRPVGEITSAAFGASLGGIVALGWAESHEPIDQACLDARNWTIDLAGTVVPVRASLAAPLDHKPARDGQP